LREVLLIEAMRTQAQIAAVKMMNGGDKGFSDAIR
jgi:hypothetical protein